MTLWGVTLLAAALVPGVALACATCIDSAYGSRTFNWAFVGLMLTPFVVGGGLVAGIAWVCRARPTVSKPGAAEDGRR